LYCFLRVIINGAAEFFTDLFKMLWGILLVLLALLALVACFVFVIGGEV